MVYYLKMNRMETFAINCLQHWVDIIAATRGDHYIYVVCDKPEIDDKILSTVYFWGIPVEFISSCRTSPELGFIVSHVANKTWANAAFAHLTTFLHAREHEYSEFWNIDADDTMVCLQAERVAQMLHTVQERANDDHLDMLGLDMWYTRFEGRHWSLGVTFTKNPSVWLEVMMHRCKDFKEYLETEEAKNSEYAQVVDWFFTYLKDYSTMKIGTFYVENMRFMHSRALYSVSPWPHELFHWKNGFLCFPTLFHGIEYRTEGESVLSNGFLRSKWKVDGLVAIPRDTIKLDIKVTDVESVRFLMSLLSVETRRIVFTEAIPQNAKIVIYGAGDTGRFLAEVVREMHHCELLCITARNHQNKHIEGVTICSVDTAVQEYAYDYIVIGILDREMNRQVWETLIKKGVSPDKIISCYWAELNNFWKRLQRANVT